MINLDDYVILLKVLEREVKPIDPTTAYNIARELSAIYLKFAYDIPMKGTIDRLQSLIAYIEKTVPNSSEILVFVLIEIIDKIKNRT